MFADSSACGLPVDVLDMKDIAAVDCGFPGGVNMMCVLEYLEWECSRLRA